MPAFRTLDAVVDSLGARTVSARADAVGRLLAAPVRTLRAVDASCQLARGSASAVLVGEAARTAS